ncbi:hypothetical protein D9M71_482380 [compost metagenome]
MFKLAHDLWQHGVGRSGAHDDQQLFAQVLEQWPHLQAGEAHHQAENQGHEGHTGQVEEADQVAQVLQRVQAIFTGGEGDRAEYADRCQSHDHAHDAENHVAEFIDQPRNTRCRLAHQIQCTAEQHGEQQDLQDVVIGKGTDHRRRNQVHQELCGGVHVLAALGNVAHVGCGKLLQVNVRAAADAGAEGEHQTDHQGDGGQHFKVDHRFEADTADLLQVAGTADAADHYAKHNQANEHFDQLDKTVTERFELSGVFGKGQPADDAEHQSENHLEED